jgi:hypothetical protein
MRIGIIGNDGRVGVTGNGNGKVLCGGVNIITGSNGGADNIYNLTLEVNDGISTSSKTIIITVDNIIEQTIAIANQSRNIAEGSAINTNVGAILEATD